MIQIKITENEENQRLDRFLKKYLRNAPLSYIYKLIRKGVKVNGKRVSPQTQLTLGDEITLFLNEEEIDSYLSNEKNLSAKKQFRIVYEDNNLLIVDKPFGLLVHGTEQEKKNTLANQVITYLIEQGTYQPTREKVFVPSPVNRLDRNTTGLVIFGKNYESLKSLNQMLRERGFIRKYYLTIVKGELKKELHLVDRMEKDKPTNKIMVLNQDTDKGKVMETVARPLCSVGGYTLVEVEIITGRTHQIRAHMAKAGYPVIGDEKYGDHQVNQRMKRRFSLTTQFLHAHRLFFSRAMAPHENMIGKEIKCPLPSNLEHICKVLFEGESINGTKER
jgi:23S rRNA pseudouridine955/2504/2580 synthase